MVSLSTPAGAYDLLVVGAGFAGSVVAERFAQAGKKVLILERREHIGGNAYDQQDTHGHLIHPYGPHIFHTNSQEVVDYLSAFTCWRPYEHRVLTRSQGHLLPMPINLTTLSATVGHQLSEEEAKAYLQSQRVACAHPVNSEEAALAAMGPTLYERFFRGYTRKQWGCNPNQIDAKVAARIPVRTNSDDRYFQDRFQQMPSEGYHVLFQRLLDHPNIDIALATGFQQHHRRLAKHLIWTGPIDRFYDRCFGELPYRSIRFVHEHLADINILQPVAVINEAEETVPYTRTTEFKHITGCRRSGTSLVREYPCSHGDPYYPIPCRQSRMLYQRYRKLADAEQSVTFVGRLGQYQYFNMDQVVAAALTTAKKLLGSDSHV